MLGLTYTDYFEVTIFGVTAEWLPRHEMDFSVALRRPWGDIYGGVEVSQYLHDTSALSAEFGGAVSVRLFEGFSLRVEGEYEMIRDQLSTSQRGRIAFGNPSPTARTGHRLLVFFLHRLHVHLRCPALRMS